MPGDSVFLGPGEHTCLLVAAWFPSLLPVARTSPGAQPGERFRPLYHLPQHDEQAAGDPPIEKGVGYFVLNWYGTNLKILYVANEHFHKWYTLFWRRKLCLSTTLFAKGEIMCWDSEHLLKHSGFLPKCFASPGKFAPPPFSRRFTLL